MGGGVEFPMNSMNWLIHPEECPPKKHPKPNSTVKTTTTLCEVHGRTSLTTDFIFYSKEDRSECIIPWDVRCCHGKEWCLIPEKLSRKEFSQGEETILNISEI